MLIMGILLLLLGILLLAQPARAGSIAQYGMAGGWSWNPIMFRHRGGTVLDRQVDPTRATVAGNEALASGIIGVFEAMYGHRYHASPETVNAAGLSGDSIRASFYSGHWRSFIFLSPPRP